MFGPIRRSLGLPILTLALALRRRVAGALTMTAPMSRRLALSLSLPAAAAGLCACGNPQAAAPAAALAVFKSAGSVQCQAGGLSTDAAQRKLADAGVSVRSAACGVDGLMHAAVCGGGDGRLVVVEIAAADAAKAAALGLALLRDLPDAKTVPCR